MHLEPDKHTSVISVRPNVAGKPSSLHDSKRIDESYPYTKQLEYLTDRDTVRVMLPGHAGRAEEYQHRFIGAEAFRRDIAQHSRGTGTLVDQTGAIGKAQRRAAQMYGAVSAHYITTGSSGAARIALASVVSQIRKQGLPPNRPPTISLLRSSHKSWTNAAADCGTNVKLRWIQPQYSTEGLKLPTTASDMKKSLHDHDDIDAVIVTTPTIMGVYANVKEIRKIIDRAAEKNKRPILLLVDAAWDARKMHLKSLATDGADIVTTSVHKRLPALTQTALILRGSDAVDIDKIKMHSERQITTSPSSVLLSSLECALENDWESGARQYAGLLLQRAGILDPELRNISNIRILRQTAHSSSGEKFTIDPTIPAVSVPASPSGYALDKALYQNGIEIAGVDGDWVALHLPASLTKSEASRISLEISEIAQKFASQTERSGGNMKQIEHQPIAEIALTPYETLHLHDHERVALDTSQGRISAGVISPFPPATPILAPGEIISKEIIEYLARADKAGAHISGPDSSGTISVVRHSESTPGTTTS